MALPLRKEPPASPRGVPDGPPSCIKEELVSSLDLGLICFHALPRTIQFLPSLCPNGEAKSLPDGLGHVLKTYPLAISRAFLSCR